MQNEIVDKRWFGFGTRAILVFMLLAVMGLNKSNAQIKPETQPSPQAEVAKVNQLPDPGTIIEGEDYHIHPNDLIFITVEHGPELSRPYQLNSKGTFIFPIIGQVLAEKKTTEELAQSIADQLSEKKYLNNPIVSVVVTVRAVKPAKILPKPITHVFVVQGEVHSPGKFELEGTPSLLEIITAAGGLNSNYGSTAFIMRKKRKPDEATQIDKTVDENADKTQKGNSSTETSIAEPKETKTSTVDESAFEMVKININNLFRGNFEQNVIVQPYDIIYIPKTDVFSVAGEVKAPGSFPLTEGMTLRRAIGLAQNVKFEGAADRGVIYREDENGRSLEIPVDIAAVMSNKKPDVKIFPNDLIMVPNSRSKTIAQGMLKTVSNGLLRALFGF